MSSRHKNPLRPLLLSAGLFAAVASAQRGGAARPIFTLEDAVAKVQRDSGGTILSAEPRHVGRNMEFRIKVLTPQGHVRVISVLADSGRPPAPMSSQSTKNPVGNLADNKERH